MLETLLYSPMILLQASSSLHPLTLPLISASNAFLALRVQLSNKRFPKVKALRTRTVENGARDCVIEGRLGMTELV